MNNRTRQVFSQQPWLYKGQKIIYINFFQKTRNLEISKNKRMAGDFVQKIKKKLTHFSKHPYLRISL